jgi:hypothetical protein
MLMITDTPSLGTDTGITVGLVALVLTMVVALVRHMTNTDHTLAALKEAQREANERQRKTDEKIQQHDLRLDRLERPDDPYRSGRTGRFAALGEEDSR